MKGKKKEEKEEEELPSHWFGYNKIPEAVTKPPAWGKGLPGIKTPKDRAFVHYVAKLIRYHTCKNSFFLFNFLDLKDITAAPSISMSNWTLTDATA